MAVATFGVSAAEASASPANIVIDEEFCGPLTTCGTVMGSLGSGTNQTVINIFTPLGGGCFHDVHTTTAQFPDGSLTFQVDGTLCTAPSPGSIEFEGIWRITGGTGSFAGAVGGGEARATRRNLGIHGVFTGRIG